MAPAPAVRAPRRHDAPVPGRLEGVGQVAAARDTTWAATVSVPASDATSGANAASVACASEVVMTARGQVRGSPQARRAASCREVDPPGTRSSVARAARSPSSPIQAPEPRSARTCPHPSTIRQTSAKSVANATTPDPTASTAPGRTSPSAPTRLVTASLATTVCDAPSRECTCRRTCSGSLRPKSPRMDHTTTSGRDRNWASNPATEASSCSRSIPPGVMAAPALRKDSLMPLP